MSRYEYEYTHTYIYIFMMCAYFPRCLFVPCTIPPPPHTLFHTYTTRAWGIGAGPATTGRQARQPEEELAREERERFGQRRRHPQSFPPKIIEKMFGRMVVVDCKKCALIFACREEQQQKPFIILLGGGGGDSRILLFWCFTCCMYDQCVVLV